MDNYKTPHEFADFLVQLLEQRGIKNYIISYRDPDRSTNFRSWSGDPFWVEGTVGSLYRDIKLHNDVMITPEDE